MQARTPAVPEEAPVSSIGVTKVDRVATLPNQFDSGDSISNRLNTFLLVFRDVTSAHQIRTISILSMNAETTNPFLDPDGYQAFLTNVERAYKEQIKREQKELP